VKTSWNGDGLGELVMKWHKTGRKWDIPDEKEIAMQV
jgi:hypothetical protein